MKPVFADSFYYMALLNRDDLDHPKTVAAARQWTGWVVTTTWTLAEVADAFAASRIRPQIRRFVERLTTARMVKVIPATQDLFNRGLALYDNRPDKEWSLTDCISFVVMQDEDISEALTGDHHFEQTGFKALLT